MSERMSFLKAVYNGMTPGLWLLFAFNVILLAVLMT
jgi:hypothetical protein